MKKTLFFSLAGLFAATMVLVMNPSAHAAKYGTAGCGLGSLAFGDKPGMVQVLAATTNGTAGNQTFGITSGTSNCTDDGIIKAQLEQEVFVASNFDTLKLQMAKGQGEAVHSLAYLMGCKQADSGYFGQVTKGNFEKIFQNSEKSPEYIHWYIKEIVRADSRLAASCSKVPKL